MNKKNLSRKNKIIYEPEDDVLNIWLSDKAYDYGEDDGDLIITHYTKEGEPVYIEILFASRFFKKHTKKSYISKKSNISTAAVPHKVSKIK